MQNALYRPAEPRPADLADLVRDLGRNSSTLLAMGVVLVVAGLGLVVLGLAFASVHT